MSTAGHQNLDWEVSLGEEQESEKSRGTWSFSDWRPLISVKVNLYVGRVKKFKGKTGVCS